MPRLNRFTRVLWDLDTYYVFNDFSGDQADTEAVDTVTDSGTVTINDEMSGIAVLTPSDGTVVANDEAYLAVPNETFKFASKRPIYGRFRAQFTEVTATKANVAFGFQNAVGADSIVDTTGLPKASGSTLAIYKTVDSAVWKCCSACNGVATHSTSVNAAVAATWYELEIECLDFDGTTMPVCFKVNYEYLKDSAGNIIKHSVPIANATEMQLFAGIKLGANTNNDTAKLDYWYGAQLRARLSL